MFKLPLDQRLNFWLNFRRKLEQSNNPIQETWDLWNSAPFVPNNHNIDPYHSNSWPSPWEIILQNIYDDFTKALMISWTLKMTEIGKNWNIEIHTVVDNQRIRQYNLVYIENNWVLNFQDQGPVDKKMIPESFNLENLIKVSAPR